MISMQCYSNEVKTRKNKKSQSVEGGKKNQYL